MTNTIPNVQRVLKPVLAMILNALDRDAADGKQARAEMAAELRALISTPSPAGVDGLEVIGHADTQPLTIRPLILRLPFHALDFDALAWFQDQAEWSIEFDDKIYRAKTPPPEELSDMRHSNIELAMLRCSYFVMSFMHLGRTAMLTEPRQHGFNFESDRRGLCSKILLSTVFDSR